MSIEIFEWQRSHDKGLDVYIDTCEFACGFEETCVPLKKQSKIILRQGEFLIWEIEVVFFIPCWAWKSLNPNAPKAHLPYLYTYDQNTLNHEIFNVAFIVIECTTWKPKSNFCTFYGERTYKRKSKYAMSIVIIFSQRINNYNKMKVSHLQLL